MDQAKSSYRWDPLPDLEARATSDKPELSADASLTKLVRMVRPSSGQAAPSISPSSPQEWTVLIERVRAAAARSREVESQAQEQELRVQKLLESVREDLAAAAERVRAAEMRASNIQAQADMRVRAAEERAEAAEARARTAEEWLQRVHEVMLNEFTAPQAKEQAA